MSPVMFSLKFDHIIYYGGRKITREDVLGWKYGFFFLSILPLKHLINTMKFFLNHVLTLKYPTLLKKTKINRTRKLK